MCKKILRLISGMMAFAMVFLGVFGQFTLEADAAKKKEYSVIINGGRTYLCNEKSLGSEIGTEYYLTYKVARAAEVGTQQGLIGTKDRTLNYPYEAGGLRYEDKCPEVVNLFEEGATYMIKMTSVKGSFRYTIIREKNGEYDEILLEKIYGAREGSEYFGLWVTGGMTTATLTNVRCYDANGNDLGLYISKGTGYVVDKLPQKNTKIKNYYEIEAKNLGALNLSQIKKATTSKVYMEYTVKAADYSITQEGGYLTANPHQTFAYTPGYLRYNNYAGKPTSEAVLLEVGAHYIISYEKTGPGLFEIFVSKTKDGVTTHYVMQTGYAQGQRERATLFGFWLYGTINHINLTNVKFYDANNNNLGVQSSLAIDIKEFGPLSDYAGCEATYYCKENGNSFALYKDQTLKFTENDATNDGTYSIMDNNNMTVKIDGESEEYNYMKRRITDNEGAQYNRLFNYKVTFVTGTKDKIETQKLSNATGYMALQPTAPEKDGYEFVEWCLKDGTTFDFEQIVTESVTLYAKYVTAEGDVHVASNNWILPVGIVGAVVLVAGAITIVLSQKRKRR